MKKNAQASMADALGAMNDPAMMAEAAKMMKDPKFLQQVQQMAKDPQFKNYMAAVSKQLCLFLAAEKTSFHALFTNKIYSHLTSHRCKI
jgi:hypothetical protein